MCGENTWRLTLGEIYRRGAQLLKKCGAEDYTYESLLLMEHFFSADKSELIMHGDKAADGKAAEGFFSAISERSNGKPLQYIIGKWGFMGLEFYVGDGVLIPRDDTEIVVEAAFDFLKSIKAPKVIDLCSGSGAIAIAIAKQFPESEVTAAELSDSAIEYLKRNKELNRADNVKIIKADVTEQCDIYNDGYFDLIVSNPPYIQSDEIDTLQRELQYEPRMALDGGSDGLNFYRAITEKWHSKLRIGGMLAYEVGEEQYEPVREMLKAHGFKDITYRIDIQGFKRTVQGFKDDSDSVFY